MSRSVAAGVGAIALAMLISGCAGQDMRELVSSRVVEAPANAIAGRHEIFVATTRAKATDAKEVYAGERAPTVSFARVDMTVPAGHKPGNIERRKRGQSPDPR